MALLLVDVINEFAFPEARALLRRALPMARALQRLKQRAKGAGVPIVYVNDNFGRWRSDFNAIVRHCARRDGRGHHVVQLLRPEADDYFVLKPKHSGFYESSLGMLLDYLGVRRLTTPQCVLFTAVDAYMRDFELVVPRDCVAAADAGQHRQALTFMSRFFAADPAIDPPCPASLASTIARPQPGTCWPFASRLQARCLAIALISSAATLAASPSAPTNHAFLDLAGRHRGAPVTVVVQR